MSASGLKALEARSSLEGSAANGVYLGRLRGPTPPIASPQLYVREVVTTVTTVYPAGAPLPVAYEAVAAG